MLNRYARAFFTRAITPIARLLLRLGVGPDTVTLLGTLGVCASAILLFPRGWMLGGTLAVTAFIFSDLLDGTMARLSGRTSKWGGFLDATLDRFGDAAIFGSLAYYFAVHHKLGMFLACMICLISGSVTSYARAKAESLGFRCDVGFVERGERLVGSLVSTGLDGLGVPYIQAIAFWALAAGSTGTVVQRMLFVRKQALALAAAGQGGLPEPNIPTAAEAPEPAPAAKDQETL
jgi:CDP-diacylglycerol---glycerol-3-phosphate 3-phosphatidyltransferase